MEKGASKLQIEIEGQHDGNLVARGADWPVVQAVSTMTSDVWMFILRLTFIDSHYLQLLQHLD